MEDLLNNKALHSLSIINKKIILDDFNLKGVVSYEIKSSAVGATELILKMVIGDSKVLVD